MPGGRKKTVKSPNSIPPTLAHQQTVHSHLHSPERSADGPLSIATGFEQFVKNALTEIRRGQDEHNRRIMKLEESFNAALEFESQRITDLEKRVKELEKLAPLLETTQKHLADHSEKLNKLERFSRRNNVRIIGHPQESNEDCLALVNTMLEEKFDMHEVKLERAHRDGPKTPGRSQHLLAKFNSYQDKVKVLRHQRQDLADVPYFCVEDLTHQDLQEKRRWATQVSKAYKEGKRYRFVAGKWRGSNGSVADFHQA